MEELKKLIGLLEESEKLSMIVIQRYLELALSLKSSESPLIFEFIEKCKKQKIEIHPPTADQILKKSLMDMVVLPELVKDQAKHFIHKEDDAFVLGSRETSFLTEVWQGDYYGETEIEGLNQLYNDLRQSLKTMTKEGLFERALNHIKSNLSHKSPLGSEGK